MQPSSITQSLLGNLSMWDRGEYFYSLYDIRDMEVHDGFIACDFVDEWFGDDFREKGYDFLEFGYNRAGDPFALWIYPELQGEPPVVRLDSDGEVELLAPSFGDFMCLLTDMECTMGDEENENVLWYGIYRYNYIDIVDEDNDFENEDEVQEKIKEEITLLRKKISKKHTCRPIKEIIKDFDRHPNFKKWFEENVEY